MPKFRKKPIVIEAEQWFPGKEIEGLGYSTFDGIAAVETLEGTMKIIPGDWVITGIAGERYPCKDEIFKATYDLVEE